MRTATYVSEAPNFKTDAILWLLDTPLNGYELIVTSIADNELAKETMVFGYSVESGADMNDLACYLDSPDHKDALTRLGYEIVS